MMLPEDLATTATFMVVGMLREQGVGPTEARYANILARWGNGAVELHITLYEYAETSEKIIEFLRENKTDFDFPGVYDYEVSEPFGQWFGDYLLTHDAAPQIEEANEKLFELVSTFFMLNDEEKHRLSVFIKELK